LEQSQRVLVALDPRRRVAAGKKFGDGFPGLGQRYGGGGGHA
jgi:hypothetical protein